ncbi:DNA recombination protein RmuC [Cellulomonas marina]|uniref:DNA recombination protein RmuC n=1 Tax=Cellulomonas marina TaxID=988821 RepID=A0A1I0ZHJ4_9CELL|nr:DNA recombination protein RmuC [Cellulomonas marina]GIG28588.1 hypothetical protein Cma02nite_11880 [Cellulomonas marina]SFB25115.1 DNA recombination protein RmuC [Cellulomonas marina]
MQTATVVAVLVGAVVALLAGVALGYVLGRARAEREGAARLARAEVEAARARERREAEREAARAEQERHAAETAVLGDRFRDVASDVLATASEQFLVLAQQRLAAGHQLQAGELAERERAVAALVDPLAGTLERVRAQLAAAEQDRAAGQAALGEQVRALREQAEGLRTETGRLSTALRSSQVRGRWGEVQLRRVVEAAGMLAHVDFVEQQRVVTDDGVQRPDLVVHLSGGRHVVVDAKVAFLGYLEAVEAADEGTRRRRLAAHARHLRAHVDGLAAKRYWEGVAPAPEFVVLFVPAEPFLLAALEEDPGLMEHAFDRDVVIATPATLLALLRTVAYAWKQDAVAANAQAVLQLGTELHGRLATLGGHLGRLGRSLEQAASAYNRTVASLETRVLVTARRFTDLGVAHEPLAAPAPVDPRLHALSAPELLEAALAEPDDAGPDRGGWGPRDTAALDAATPDAAREPQDGHPRAAGA